MKNERNDFRQKDSAWKGRKAANKFFGDVVHKSTLSDGENYRFLEFVYLYNETTNKIKKFYPSDLVPEGLPIGDDGLPAYKARPEKKQEMIDELKNMIDNME